MIKNGFLILLVGIVVGCSPEEKNGNEPEPQNPLTGITAEILTPKQIRDYSFHNAEEPLQGYEGVFADPGKELSFTGAVQIEHSGDAQAEEMPPVEVVWRSNVDGILFQGRLEDNRETNLQKKLSKGIHTVFLEASIPGTTFTAKDSIILSNSIELRAENTGRSVRLHWSKYQGEDFISYLIYKQDYTPVAEITDINTLDYLLTGGNSFIAEHEYQVVVRTTRPYDHPVGSNIAKQHAGIFFMFPHFVHKIIKDPLRQKVYAIVGPQYSHYDSTTFGLLIIDVKENTFEIESHILQDRKFADLDISPDGQYLFLVQKNVDQITKLDLDLLEAETFVTNTNSWGFHKIEVGLNSTLYCHRNPPTSGSSSFWIYNGDSGKLISSNTSGLRHGDIEYNKNNSSLYGGESNTSSGRMHRFSVDGYSINWDRDYPSWPEYAAYPEPYIFLSDDNQYILWEKFQLDLDLNLIRSFEEKMKAASPGNKYLATFEALYNFDDLEMVWKYPQLPTGDISSMVFIDDETVVLARAENTGVNQEEYTYFFKINLTE